METLDVLCFLFDSLTSKSKALFSSSKGFVLSNPFSSAFSKSRSPFSVRMIVKVQSFSPRPPAEMSASSEEKSVHGGHPLRVYVFASARGIVSIFPDLVVTKIFPLMLILLISYRLMPSFLWMWFSISPLYVKDSVHISPMVNCSGLEYFLRGIISIFRRA